MKKLIVIVVVVMIAGFTSSCSKHDSASNSGVSKIQLLVKSTYTNSSLIKSATPESFLGTKGTALVASTIALDTFLINIKDIELGLDEQSDGNYENHDMDGGHEGEFEGDQEGEHKGDNGEDNEADEHEVIYPGLEGPFLLDLLSPEAINGLPFASAELPDSSYNEIKFKLDKYTLDIAKQIYNHSVFITGTLDGKRMRMWYSGDYEFKIEFPDSTKNLKLTGTDIKLYIDFHINNLITALSNVDFSSAQDGNGNGIIEIGSDDPDGNSELAHNIVEAVIKSCDLDDNNNNDSDEHNESDHTDGNE